MKSPSRRLRRLVGAGVAGLLVVGLAPVLTSGVAQAASTGTNPPAFLALNQTVIGTGQAGSAGGDIRIGASTDTFDAGDQITLQVAQPGVGTPTTAPTACDERELQQRTRAATSLTGDRRFVSFAATPTGVWSDRRHAHAAARRCRVVDGCWRQRHHPRLLQRAGRRHRRRTSSSSPSPRPALVRSSISNIRYDVGRGTGQANNAGPTLRATSRRRPAPCASSCSSRTCATASRPSPRPTRPTV